MFYTFAKTIELFSAADSTPITLAEIESMVLSKRLPKPHKGRGGLGFKSTDILRVSEQLSRLPRPSQPIVASMFVTKGGVLKTSMTLNFARLLALHGIQTLVIGLDLQGDVTTALGHEYVKDGASLESALQEIDSTYGLYDYFSGQIGLNDIILKTDLDTLDYIPETPELMALEQQLNLKSRREYWLSEKVIEPLKRKYQVILLDCSPNWSQLITNALTASTTVISPIECRINNYRNLRMFRSLISQFQKDLHLSFQHIFIPTRLQQNRKLSREIGLWYKSNVPGCTVEAVRESIQGEEAMALHLSLLEHQPSTEAGQEFRRLFWEVWKLVLSGRREITHSKDSQWQLDLVRPTSAPEF